MHITYSKVAAAAEAAVTTVQDVSAHSLPSPPPAYTEVTTSSDDESDDIIEEFPPPPPILTPDGHASYPDLRFISEPLKPRPKAYSPREIAHGEIRLSEHKPLTRHDSWV